MPPRVTDRRDSRQGRPMRRRPARGGRPCTTTAIVLSAGEKWPTTAASTARAGCAGWTSRPIPKRFERSVCRFPRRWHACMSARRTVAWSREPGPSRPSGNSSLTTAGSPGWFAPSICSLRSTSLIDDSPGGACAAVALRGSALWLEHRQTAALQQASPMATRLPPRHMPIPSRGPHPQPLRHLLERKRRIFRQRPRLLKVAFVRRRGPAPDATSGLGRIEPGAGALVRSPVSPSAASSPQAHCHCRTPDIRFLSH